MNTKNYGPLGWKLPILDLQDPDYCEYGCPICRRARQGNRLAKIAQSIEMMVTRGGCPWGRAEKKYGVPPSEPLPPDDSDREGA